MEPESCDVSRGRVRAYKYRLAVLGFIHKTESYRHSRDTRSWDLGTLLLWFLETVKFGYFFPERNFLEGFF